NRVNVNLAKGLWGQWSAVASRLLRSVALHEIPAEVWEKLEQHAPDDGLQTRRSARLEPGDGAAVRNREASPRSQPPPSSLLPPVTNHPPEPSVPVDLTPPVAPDIPEDSKRLGLEQLEALKRERRPALHVVEDTPNPA